MSPDQGLSVSVADRKTVRVGETFPRPGARPKRAMSRKELLRLGRSRKKVDALLMAFSAWMADKKPRPLRPQSRYSMTMKIRRAFDIAEAGGVSFLAADVRTIRYVLGTISPEPSTQNTYISAFKLFFAFLKLQGVRKDNPALEIGRPPPKRTLPRPLPIDDVCKYLDAAIELGIEHYTIAVLGLHMGFRREDIRTCQWSMFFEADGRWWCDVRGKGGSFERVGVHEQVRWAVRQLRRAHNDARWLFPTRRPEINAGEAASPSWIEKMHYEIVDASGIDRVTLHQLRHSYITYLRRSGNDVAVVQKGARHRAIQSTQIYDQVLDDEIADANEGLDFRALAADAQRRREEREQKAALDSARKEFDHGDHEGRERGETG
jgi:integrase/recombinase XerD